MPANHVQEFPIGKPTVIALKYRTGKPGRNQYGDYVFYNLTNGKAAFFPPEVDKAIQSLHLGANEAFQVTKRKTGESFAWDFERLPQEVTEPSDQRESQTSTPAARSVLANKSPQNNTGSPQDTPVTTPESQRLTRQLIAATEAVMAAQKYARSIGLEVEFRASDIRALAISGFISQGRF